MKIKNIAFSVLFLTIALTANIASADDDRFVIQVNEGKKGLVKALAQTQGGHIHVDAHGFLAASFKGKSLSEVKGLLNNPHITLIEEDLRRYPLSAYTDDIGDPMNTQITPYAVYQSQANQVAFEPSSGMKICVIDSGLDQSNPDFTWSNITGDNDIGTGNWFEHGGPHGTHVAGTIGATNNNFGVVGMAPGVEMHIIKVFNANGWGYSSDLAHATQLCQAAGSNIISMSLGGGSANSIEENAFNAFQADGGLVLAAAGNDGNNTRTYPAGYSSVMMIGANDANNNIADFSQYPSCLTGRGKRQKSDETICVEVTAGGVDTLSTYPAGMAFTTSLFADTKQYDSEPMENKGYATGNLYFMGIGNNIDPDANGKICLIDRGSISFYDKTKNCETSGGLAAIIINNEAGMLYATLGTTNDTTIPVVGTALEDRSSLLAASSASINIGDSDYGLMSGTSMATPAVSGIAALVWSNHPECTGEDIRSALKITAEDHGTTGKDDKFGFGIVKAKSATDYLASNPCSDGNDGGETGNDLIATGERVKGGKELRISWSGFSGADVIVNINNQAFTEKNDGFAAYSGNRNTLYTVFICETDNSLCSSEFEL